MERVIRDAAGLVEAPLGTQVAEKPFAGWGPVRLERVLAGWRALDENDEPSGATYLHHEVRLPADVLRAGYGGETD